jgi:hypothetical protein
MHPGAPSWLQHGRHPAAQAGRRTVTPQWTFTLWCPAEAVVVAALVVAPAISVSPVVAQSGERIFAAAERSPIPVDTHSDTELAQALKAEQLSDVEVEELLGTCEWAWVE